MNYAANALENETNYETEKKKNTHSETHNEQVLKNLDSEKLQQLVDIIQRCKSKPKVVL